jgi:HlyD family secretion protein
VVLVVAVPVIGALAAAGWSSVARNGSGPQGTLVLHGNVDIRQVELAFNASERIDQVLVREGEAVKKGQPLAMLDTERQRYAVEQARAQVAAQRQVVARFEAGSRPEEIGKANADMEAAKVDVATAQSNHARQLDLVAKHFVSQQHADNAKFALDAAQARLNSARHALRLVVLGPRKEDTEGAKASLAAHAAALALAERDLAQGSLYAPADGVIENRILEPGDMASPQKPVFTLALTDPLWVRAYVAEPGLGRIRVGSPAYVSTDSHPGKRYRAWIGFISPTAEFTPKSVETEEVRTALVYQLRVFVCAADGELPKEKMKEK